MFWQIFLQKYHFFTSKPVTDIKHFVKLLADVNLQNELQLWIQSCQIFQFCQTKLEDEKLEWSLKWQFVLFVSEIERKLYE